VSWRDDPRGPYVRMHSGAKVYLREPSPEQIRIPDVAKHLAGIRRFTGAGISVAQHSVVGARMAKKYYWDDPLMAAKFLIHDTVEHILGDVSSPLKSVLVEYRGLERSWEWAAEKRFALHFVGDPMVKEVDDRMWLTEAQWVYSKSGVDRSEDYTGPLRPFPHTEDLDFVWPDYVAETVWLREMDNFLPWVHQ